MVYLSEWIGNVVNDSRGYPAGILKDLVISGAFELAEPRVVAVVLQQTRQDVILSALDLLETRDTCVALLCALENARRYEPRPGDLSIIQISWIKKPS